MCYSHYYWAVTCVDIYLLLSEKLMATVTRMCLLLSISLGRSRKRASALFDTSIYVFINRNAVTIPDGTHNRVASIMKSAITGIDVAHIHSRQIKWKRQYRQRVTFNVTFDLVELITDFRTSQFQFCLDMSQAWGDQMNFLIGVEPARRFRFYRHILIYLSINFMWPYFNSTSKTSWRF